MLYFGAAFVLVLLPLLDRLAGLEVLNFLINRRIFFMPSVASQIYFEEFSSAPLYFWSSSFLSGFYTPPLSYASPPFQIGSVIFGGSEVSANANFLADAYANGGGIGLMAIGALAGLLLWFLDSVSANADIEVSVPLVAVPAFALANSALPSVLFTHGLLPVMALSYLLSGPFSKARPSGQAVERSAEPPVR
jgi:hypothetical protein